jgi:hypothetical protein
MKREDHCTHPEKTWCDCDWCRLVRARTCEVCGRDTKTHKPRSADCYMYAAKVRYGL